VRTLSGHKGSILTIEFSPDSALLASASGTDKVLPSGIGENVTKIWYTETWEWIADLPGHRDGIINVRWSPDGSMLATASDDRTIKIWDATKLILINTLTGHKSGVLHVAWSPDGTRLVSGGRDYKIMVWDIKSGKYIARWSEANCIRSVDWHPSGKYILTSGVEEVALKIRDAENGKILKILAESLETDSSVLASRWTPDGRYIVAGTGKDHTVRVYGIKEVPVKHEIPDWVKGVIIFCIAGSIIVFIIIYKLTKMFRTRRR
jgi:WD40 repeat protein